MGREHGDIIQDALSPRGAKKKKFVVKVGDIVVRLSNKAANDERVQKNLESEERQRDVFDSLGDIVMLFSDLNDEMSVVDEYPAREAEGYRDDLLSTGKKGFLAGKGLTPRIGARNRDKGDRL